MGNHMAETGHKFTTIDNDLEILHQENKGTLMNILEQIEIDKAQRFNPSHNLNEIIFETSILYRTLIDELYCNR